VKNAVKNSFSLRIVLIASHVLLIPITVVAQTNEQLLKDGLISPYMFYLLNKQGAKTPEARIEQSKRFALRVILNLLIAIKTKLLTGPTDECRKQVIIKINNFD